MAIDREGLKHLEDSLMHDEDDEPQHKGWGIYATPKFLSRVTMIMYAVMVVVVLLADRAYTGARIPIILMPASLLVGLPFAVVALYVDITSDPEPSLAKKRTMIGRLLAAVVTWVILELGTILVWLGMVHAFSFQ